MGRMLAGKRALITGTGRGQGEAIQRLFVKLGARVIGCDIIPGSAEATAAALKAEGYDAAGRTVDLGDPDAAKAWVEWGAEQLGGIDVLFNNAGRTTVGPFAEMTLEDWRTTVQNELDILFYVTHPAWPHLVNSGAASVINTASIMGKMGWAGLGQAVHAATKGGVIGLTKQLAAEGGPVGVRVNSISPGVVLTPVTEGVLSDNFAAHMRETLQLDPRRRISPEDIAMAGAFLASDASLSITGADIPVDAGWGAGRP
jgi:NAD(P)-dependent dehydrogenase (short-subunit alcohol dehydrogenase family)